MGKGTNRAEFFRGQVNKYGWCDMGSSFLPSEINAAFLWAQLEHLEEIQAKRKHIWNRYHDRLKTLEECDCFRMPDIPDYATNNAHMFYLVCRSLEERSGLIQVLKDNDIVAPFHYLSLHRSEYYKDKHDGRKLPFCDGYMDTLVRMPLYYELTDEQQDNIINVVKRYYEE